MPRVGLGLVLTALVATVLPLSPAGAVPVTDLALDAGTSATHLQRSVRGGSAAAGVLVAERSTVSPALQRGRQLLVGSATTVMPSTFTNDSYSGGLLGTFAVSLESNETVVAFDDVSSGDTGTVALGPTSRLLSVGPAGWVEADTAARTVTYVQPTGTGVGASVTRHVLHTYGLTGQEWTFSGSADATGVLVEAACASCGTSSELRYLPFDTNLLTTALEDPSDAFDAPVMSTHLAGSGLRALTCVSATTCFGGDQTGALLSTVNAGAGAGAWSRHPLSTSPVIAVSCTAAPFCVAADENGGVFTSDDPNNVSASWTSVTLAGAMGQLSCPTVSFCAGRDTGGTVWVTDAPSTSAWTPVPLTASVAQMSCPAVNRCVALDYDGVVYGTTTPLDTSSWATTGATVFSPSALSCTPTRCAVGSNDGSVSLASDPVNGSWDQQPVSQHVDAPSPIVALACDAATCLAGDYVGSLWRNGAVGSSTTWDDVTTGTGVANLLVCSGARCLEGLSAGLLATSGDNGITFGTPTRVTTEVAAEVVSLTCPDATTCWLLDGYAGESPGRLLVSTDGGSVYDTPATSPAFAPSALLCPAAGSCLAYDTSGQVTVTSDGGTTWSAPVNLGLTTVSGACPSTTLCVLGTDTGEVLVSTTPFGAGTWAPPAATGLGNVGKLACSGSTCLAADPQSSGALRQTQSVVSGDWGLATTELAGVSALACPSATVCLAADEGGQVAVSTDLAANAWATAPAAALSQGVNALTCPSATLCLAASGGGLSVSTTPSSGAAGFRAPARTGLASPTRAVTCRSATACFVVGDGGNVSAVPDVTKAEGHNGFQSLVDQAGGALWVRQPVVPSGSLVEFQRYSLTTGAAVGAPQLRVANGPFAVTPQRDFWFAGGELRTADADGANELPLTAPADACSLASAGTAAVWSQCDGTVKRLDDGSSSASLVLAADFEPVATHGVALSPGRVAYADDQADGQVSSNPNPVWARSLSSTGAGLAAGTPSLVAHTSSGASLSLSGTRLVVADRQADAYTVRTGSATPVVLPKLGQIMIAEQYTAARSSFSGVDLLEPFYDGAGLAWRLRNVVTGTSTALAAGGAWRAAHLSGRYVSAVTASGSVVRKDLLSGTTTAVAPAPGLAFDEQLGDAQVDSAGTAAVWVLQVFGTSGQSFLGGFRRGPADTVHALDLTAAQVPEAAISTQYLAVTDASRSGLVVKRLSDLVDVPSSVALPSFNGYNRELPLDLDANVLGYEGADGYAHVAQLPAVSDPPYVLQDASRQDYTLGGGRTWTADVVASRPLTTCAFTIKSGTTTVRSLPCNAAAMAMGEAAAAWDGKSTAGTVVPVGTYTWTLTASGTDGALRRSDATAGTVTGVVRVALPVKVASLTAAPSTTSAFTVTLSRDAYNASTSNVRLRLSGSTANLATKVSCVSSGGTGVSCAGPFRSVRVTPVSPLVPGASYRVLLDPSGTVSPVKDVLGVPAVAYTSAALRIRTADDLGMVERWGALSSSSAVGGSTARERRAGATFTTTFTGTGVRYWYLRGKDAGRVKVTVDGVVKDAALDQYGATARAYRTYTGLASGTHTLAVTVLGTRQAASTGTFGNVDAVSTPTATCGSTSGCTYTPVGFRWSTTPVTGALGGRAAVSDVLGAAVTRTFVGTGFDLYRLVGPAQGYLAVYVDGHLVATLNGYATSNAVRAYTRTGLTSATHTLTVTVLHKAGKTGTSAYAVTVDRLVAR